MAKKPRVPKASTAPQEGSASSHLLPGQLVVRGDIDSIPAGSPSVEILDIELDPMAGTMALDWQLKFRPPTRALDPAFDPWTATKADVSARGLHSAEASAWMFAQVTLANRKAIESDGAQLLEAVAAVMDWGLRSPEWLATAFRQRLGVFQAYDTSSLDRAFGVAPRNERSLKTLREGRHFRGKVHAALIERLRANPDRPIGNELWEEVAEQFGMGREKVKGLYEKAVAEDGARELVAFKRMLKVANMNADETANSPVIQKRR